MSKRIVLNPVTRIEGHAKISIYLIEILTCIERIEIALEGPALQSDQLRARADVNQLEAIGVGEAPRRPLGSDGGC